MRSQEGKLHIRVLRRTLLGASLLTVIAAIVVACSSTSTGEPTAASSSVVITGPAGTATRSNPAPYMTLWDPCSLPTSINKELYLQEFRHSVDNLEPQRSCGYLTVDDASIPSPHVNAYGLNLTVTEFTFDETKRNSSIIDPVPTTMPDGHPAAIAGSRSDPRAKQLFWGTSYGTVLIQIFPDTDETPIDVPAMLNKFVSTTYHFIP